MSSTLHSALTDLTWACVVVFLIAWIVGAMWFGLKSPAGARGWLRGMRRTMVSRVGLVLVAVGISQLVGRAPQGFWRHLQYWQPVLGVIGGVLVVCSTGLLLWARWVLGTMWASVPLVQERHELRTDGPYRFVRHPIYTGFLGLVLGGALACGFGVWVVFIVLAVPWLLRRVRVEDRLMAGEFGATYEEYRARVPALLPRLPRVGR